MSAGGPEHWRWRAEAVAGAAVVFDMDGVLSDASGRQHFLAGDPRDWDGFFGAAGEDPLLHDTAVLLGALDPGLRVVLLTARPLRVRPPTLAWLERHGLRWDLLVMRPDDDERSSTAFKRRTVGELRAAGLELRLAFEDDRANVAMLRDEGVPCVYIHSGYYE